MDTKKPYLAVVFVQIIYAGMILLSKAAFNGGMSSYVFVFYRQAAGTVFILPLAIIFERKNAMPLSFVTFCKIFLLSFLGITLAINAYCIALIYTSATLGAETINCLPVATFFFAVLLRMEKVEIKTRAGIAKVAGLVLCMTGVATLAFYKGPYFKPFLHHYPLEYHNTQHDQPHHDASNSQPRWIIGCFLLFISIICWSLWLVLQARLLKKYPAKLCFTSLQCLSSAVQSFVVAIALERNPSQWKLGCNVDLLAVAYCGIMVTGISYYLQAYVIEKKGPVFQAMSQPLNLIITIIGSVFLLGEAINLGSVMGGIMLVVSLYSVLWGKSKEENMENQACLPLQAEKEGADQGVKEQEASDDHH